jgi:hypothetical protein
MTLKTATTLAFLAVLLGALVDGWGLFAYYQLSQEKSFEIETATLVRWGLDIVCELGLATFFLVLRRNQK